MDLKIESMPGERNPALKTGSFNRTGKFLACRFKSMLGSLQQKTGTCGERTEPIVLYSIRRKLKRGP